MSNQIKLMADMTQTGHMEQLGLGSTLRFIPRANGVQLIPISIELMLEEDYGQDVQFRLNGQRLDEVTAIENKHTATSSGFRLFGKPKFVELELLVDGKVVFSHDFPLVATRC
ncbi:MAG TPA: hypothetical protein V6C97_12855 [Oculatellaceae cyanobacterium]